MRKKIITVFAVCLLALCLTVVFVACDDNTGGGGGDDKGTLYSIQAPAASEVYTVSGLPEGAYEGDTVTFTVTLTNPADSSILGVTVEPAFDSSFDLTETSDGFYSFVMPADDVTVVIDAKTYETVLSDGGVSFSTDNPTAISVNGSNDTVWGGPDGTDLINVWTFDLSFNWSYTAALSSRSYVTSSNQDVIPADAISELEEGDKGSSAWIHGASFYIDPSKINAGTTWLEIYLQSNNSSSSKGTLYVKITVTEEGVIQKTEKWTETVVFELESGVDTDTLVLYFKDENYADNLDSQEYQYFYPEDYTVDNGEITVEIEYVKGHTYSVYAAINGTGDSYELGNTVVNGGSYTDGALTFEREGVTINITVYDTLWRP